MLEALRAAAVLVSHLVIAALIITSIRVLEWWIQYLWNSNDPLLFDRFPIRYLFHAMDTGVILAFIWFGIISASRVFAERSDVI
jgi:hypothetical protein